MSIQSLGTSQHLLDGAISQNQPWQEKADPDQKYLKIYRDTFIKVNCVTKLFLGCPTYLPVVLNLNLYR